MLARRLPAVAQRLGQRPPMCSTPSRPGGLAVAQRRGGLSRAHCDLVPEPRSVLQYQLPRKHALTLDASIFTCAAKTYDWMPAEAGGLRCRIRRVADDPIRGEAEVIVAVQPAHAARRTAPGHLNARRRGTSICLHSAGALPTRAWPLPGTAALHKNTEGGTSSCWRAYRALMATQATQ